MSNSTSEHTGEMKMKVTVETIIRETEKAYLVACEIETCAGRKGKEVWWPKSQVAIEDHDMEVPAWLYQAKLDQVAGRNLPGGVWFN